MGTTNDTPAAGNLRGDLAVNTGSLDPVLRQLGNLVLDLVTKATAQQHILGITKVGPDLRVLREQESGDRSLAFGVQVMHSGNYRVRIEKLT